jgi:multifunctional 2-oxoglutarate metabolism enzyme
VIQGAESGMFLGRIQALIEGADDFYTNIFQALGIAQRPVIWTNDRLPVPRQLSGGGGRTEGASKDAAIVQLISAFRVRGHMMADLDPLGNELVHHADLDPATYGFTIWDLDREFDTGTFGGGLKPVATLREILDTLRQTYCNKVASQYMYIQDPEQVAWIQDRLERTGLNWPLAPEHRVRMLERVITAEQFESFLHTRFVGQKRFSLEGAETAIAVLDEIMEQAASANVHEVVIGMAHRGRLNVLSNIVGKPHSQIFSEFEQHPDPNATQGSGDVKYHLGATGIHRSPTGHEVVVSMAPNPSHLEAVNPVVEGIVRPKQDRLGDKARKRVIPVLIHGDAAFAGQGVVAETLNLSQLEGYTTGGTIHLVINNKIGFTTAPEDSRTSGYCTDIARSILAPIFHVNGDDPEMCIRVIQLAFDYRQKFGQDVVVDMVCYRRHGHNEGDDPSITSPVLYRKIKDHASVGTLYGERLARENVVRAGQVDELRKSVAARMDQGFEQARQRAVTYEIQEMAVVSDWAHSPNIEHRTAADAALVARAVEGMTSFPETFTLHPKLKAFFEKRRDALVNGGPIDWAFGEALAFSTLVMQGTPVRLSGQDSGRGTFNQRHLVAHDYDNGSQHIPLQHLSADQARFEVWDSSLSEFGVLGYEFGFSVGDPMTLVMWEAQFGDFVNGAQVMIDQFISTCESKWGQPSGLVMLLPHGYEGQGPEHSSARMERFLTLCAEENMIVANVSTPAQYFHILRRQMFGGTDGRGMRKPLILFTPKSLLRHARCVSRMEDITRGGFQRMLGETGTLMMEKVRRVLLCSGKVYYDLLDAREKRGINDVAILRVEQVYPFPNEEIQDQLARYPLGADVAWVQEEPRNMGAWRFIRTPVQPMLDQTRRKLRYIGRPEAASPAAGSSKLHAQEQADIMEAAFHPDQISPAKKVRLVRRKA